MSKLLAQIAEFLLSEDGPTAVEYAVMLAFIIAVCVGAIEHLGVHTNDAFTDAAAAIP